MRIGILTGGGDVPGLNPCIKAVVNRAIDEGHEIVGIRRGWSGLLLIDRDDPETINEYTRPLSREAVRTIDRSGGTILHSSRTNPSKVSRKKVPDFLKDPDHLEAEDSDDRPRDFTAHVLENLEHGCSCLTYQIRITEQSISTLTTVTQEQIDKTSTMCGKMAILSSTT